MSFIISGKEAALEVAKRGGTVHMICRSEERGKQAQQEIKDSCSNENVHLHILDMSIPENVQGFAMKFIEDERPLHVLVNNAGCMVNDRQVDENGLEKNFATNTFGTYLLTTALADHIKKHESPRVITVTSGINIIFIHLWKHISWKLAVFHKNKAKLATQESFWQYFGS